MRDSVQALWTPPAKRTFTPEERLYIDVDPLESMGPLSREEVLGHVYSMVDLFAPLGVGIKLESSLVHGAELIIELRRAGVRVFADYKFSGTPEALARKGNQLRQYAPEFLTVMCSTGLKGLEALKEALPETEVLGVTFLTSLSKNDALHLHGCVSELSAALKLAHIARSANLGVVCAPAEVEFIRDRSDGDYIICATNFRDKETVVLNDDQNRKRSMPLGRTFKAGATHAVVGRMITESAYPPYDAARRVLDEIAKATS